MPPVTACMVPTIAQTAPLIAGIEASVAGIEAVTAHMHVESFCVFTYFVLLLFEREFLPQIYTGY